MFQHKPFSTASSYPLPPSPLSPALEEPQAVGQQFLSQFYRGVRSHQNGHFCLLQAESESAVACLRAAEGSWVCQKLGASKVGLGGRGSPGDGGCFKAFKG